MCVRAVRRTAGRRSRRRRLGNTITDERPVENAACKTSPQVRRTHSAGATSEAPSGPKAMAAALHPSQSLNVAHSPVAPGVVALPLPIGGVGARYQGRRRKWVGGARLRPPRASTATAAADLPATTGRTAPQTATATETETDASLTHVAETAIVVVQPPAGSQHLLAGQPQADTVHAQAVKKSKTHIHHPTGGVPPLQHRVATPNRGRAKHNRHTADYSAVLALVIYDDEQQRRTDREVHCARLAGRVTVAAAAQRLCASVLHGAVPTSTPRAVTVPPAGTWWTARCRRATVSRAVDRRVRAVHKPKTTLYFRHCPDALMRLRAVAASLLLAVACSALRVAPPTPCVYDAIRVDVDGLCPPVEAAGSDVDTSHALQAAVNASLWLDVVDDTSGAVAKVDITTSAACGGVATFRLSTPGTYTVTACRGGDDATSQVALCMRGGLPVVGARDCVGGSGAVCSVASQF